MSNDLLDAILNTVAAVFFAVSVVFGISRHGDFLTALFAWFGGMNTAFALWWWHRWLSPPNHTSR